MSGLKRLLRRPAPRVFSPKAIPDLQSVASEPSGIQDTISLSAFDVSDAIALTANQSSRPSQRSSLPSTRSNSLPQLIKRAEDLSVDLDPVLLTRIISNMARLDSQLDSFVPIFVSRCEDMSLGCFSRSLFCLSQRHASSELYVSAARRAKYLIADLERVPARVVSKLCCSFAHLRGFGVDDDLWASLERLGLQSAPKLDSSQLAQVSFAFSVVGRSSPTLTPALIKRGIELSPIAPMETYMNTLVSLAKLTNRQGEEWRMFEKIARDFLSLRDGYIPVPVLRNALQRYNLTDVQLKRILGAFKQVKEIQKIDS